MRLKYSATVHCGQDIISEEVVAIKLELVAKNPISSLHHEFSVLSLLQGTAGFPRTLWFGREGGYRVMVLESLGSSLDKSVSCGTTDLGHVARVGLQMVSEL